MNVFEMVINGATYTTKKLTPYLRGKLTQVSAHLMRSAEGISTAELQNPNNYPDWLKTMISGMLWEHLPAVMWEFIHPEDKTRIGTQDNFHDSLTDELLGTFYAWGMGQIAKAGEQVKKTPTTEESESPSTTLSISSAESTDGAEITLNPSAN